MLPNSAFYLNLIGGLAPEKRARRVESNIPSTPRGPTWYGGCWKNLIFKFRFFRRTSFSGLGLRVIDGSSPCELICQISYIPWYEKLYVLSLVVWVLCKWWSELLNYTM